MSVVRVALAEDNVLLREGVSRLVSDATDLPPEAATSGAIAYVGKERLAADTLRQLWEGRGAGSFVSCWGEDWHGR
jgi:hypothetical protein